MGDFDMTDVEEDTETSVRGIQAYAVLSQDGTVKTRAGQNRGRVGTLYLTLTGAKSAARAPGDSVVALVIPRARPLFIRGSRG